MDLWIGKSISLHHKSVVYQGVISSVASDAIRINRVCANGVPFKDKHFEYDFKANEIDKLKLIADIPDDPIPIPQAQQRTTPKPVNSVLSQLLGSKIGQTNESTGESIHQVPHRPISKSIDIPSKSNPNTPYKSDKRKYNRQIQNEQTFSASVDDPMLDEDFDFEKNLALFDKQAIWNQIDGIQKQPDLVRHSKSKSTNRKYRHDENILTSEAAKLRQIEVGSNKQQEYVTDVGLVIPSISLETRNGIQWVAENNGLTWERMCDNIARSTTEIAILLIGGARRLIPTNHHQWPRIVILCDQQYTDRHSELGLSIGRHLSSHGLNTVVYVQYTKTADGQSIHSNELDLYSATNNPYTNDAKTLPPCDLIILSSQSRKLDENLLKWISDSNRAPILAVDPPSTGFDKITLKCSILPILPIDGLSSSCGKLYLANLSIPDRFYCEAGIKYSSPFGHKSVIPIHTVN